MIDLICEKCGKLKGDTPTETVPDRGPGWKCKKCDWWNWIRSDEGEPGGNNDN